MTNSLPADLAQFVQREMAAGHYQSVEEMVCDSLRLLRTRQEKMEGLRRELQPALERLDRGEGIHVKFEEIGDFLNQIAAEVKAQLGAAEQRGA